MFMTVWCDCCCCCCGGGGGGFLFVCVLVLVCCIASLLNAIIRCCLRLLQWIGVGVYVLCVSVKRYIGGGGGGGAATL